MRAEMSNMGNKSIRQQTVPTGEIRRIHQPGQKKGAVGIGGQRDRIQDNTGGNSFLHSGDLAKNSRL